MPRLEPEGIGGIPADREQPLTRALPARDRGSAKMGTAGHRKVRKRRRRWESVEARHAGDQGMPNRKLPGWYTAAVSLMKSFGNDEPPRGAESGQSHPEMQGVPPGGWREVRTGRCERRLGSGFSMQDQGRCRGIGRRRQMCAPDRARQAEILRLVRSGWSAAERRLFCRGVFAPWPIFVGCGIREGD